MLVNGELQKRAGEIAAEVAIALALSDLRGAGARPMLPSHPPWKTQSHIRFAKYPISEFYHTASYLIRNSLLSCLLVVVQAPVRQPPTRRQASWRRMALAYAAGVMRARWHASGPPGTSGATMACDQDLQELQGQCRAYV